MTEMITHDLFTDGGIHARVTMSASPDAKGSFLLMPSPGTTLAMWEDVVPPLTDDFDVIAIDTRAHDPSTPLPDQRLIAARVPGAELVIFESAAHMIPPVEPSGLARALRATADRAVAA
jgi:pimeloyl-ACP methyl ester carboxylesterase